MFEHFKSLKTSVTYTIYLKKRILTKKRYSKVLEIWIKWTLISNEFQDFQSQISENLEKINDTSKDGLFNQGCKCMGDEKCPFSVVRYFDVIYELELKLYILQFLPPITV